MRARVREPICRAMLPAVLLATAIAHAQSEPSFSGTWQAGATSMDVTVESWGKDCGPQPAPMHSAGGGTVRIEQTDQVLVLHGGERDVRTDQCWSPNPTLRKISSTAANAAWVTRCKTGKDDPREEAGTYTLKAQTADRLLYQDVSHFNWKLNESTCVATLTTTQTLNRVVAAAGHTAPSATPQPQAKAGTTATEPRGAPAPSAAAPPPTCRPGAAARLSLRPRRAAIELGQRVCFRAQVTDAAGCALPNAQVAWSLEHGPGIKAKLQGGCFQAGERSAESEGNFQVIAAAGALRAEAGVRVSAESLTALIASRLETSGLGDDEEPATQAAAPAQPSPAATAPSSRVAVRAVAEPRRGRDNLLVGAAALLAAAAGVLLLRRRSSARPRASSQKSRPRERRCPKCGATYPESHAFCGVDGSELSAPR